MDRILGALILPVLVAPLVLAQAPDDKPWAWYDKNGYHVRDLSGADLHGADLRTVNMRGAKLEGAELGDANLRGATLVYSHLKKAYLLGAHLEKTNLNGSDLAEANLNEANLSEASLRDASLVGASLDQTHLNGANLTGANLSRTHMGGTILIGADLTDADLSEAQISYKADFSGVIYEPKGTPDLREINNASGLGQLAWRNDSGPVFALRKSLRDAGFSEAARQVTAAINRHNQSWLQWLFFDKTCEWGANWSRPLKLVGILLLMCTAIYWMGMHFGSKSGIYVVAKSQPLATGNSRERLFRIAVQRPRPPSFPHRFIRFASNEFRLGKIALLFSLMSIVNIGFREFDFGRWIRMIQPRQFDIRARGWMRTLSGIQSLLGVGLIALSLLSYFGHPFD
jgi:Pentapeptide repeats (8 copies)